jgi:hypothetical protein
MTRRAVSEEQLLKHGSHVLVATNAQAQEAWNQWQAGTFGDVSLADGLLEYEKTNGGLGCTGSPPMSSGESLLATSFAWPKKNAATFFGGAVTPTPKKATSYKDYNDQWLGSADLGFDPLNLAVGSGTFDTAATAVPETTYYNYRESEVKHGRFAMTAFLAIFFEEADRGAVMQQLGFSGAVDNLDATLGLDEVQGPVLAIGLGLQALAEYNLQKSEDDGNILSVEYKADRCPGDLGFDPLSLAGTDKNKAYLHNVEVNTGRLGMIGVTAFLLKEFVAKDL